MLLTIYDYIRVTYNWAKSFAVLIEQLQRQDGRIDEATNRTSVCLLALANVARVSLVCEKKAISAMCQMTKERSWEVSLVQKVGSTYI